jgi:hypothetical protein
VIYTESLLETFDLVPCQATFAGRWHGTDGTGQAIPGG